MTFGEVSNRVYYMFVRRFNVTVNFGKTNEGKREPIRVSVRVGWCWYGVVSQLGNAKVAGSGLVLANFLLCCSIFRCVPPDMRKKLH